MNREHRPGKVGSEQSERTGFPFGRATLGIIAGGGDLPRAVAESAREAGREVFVLGLEGSLTESWPQAYPHALVSIGSPGRAIKALKAASVSEVLLAGKVERPKFNELKLDTKGVMVLPRVIAAARKGDDALLRFMVGLFEEEGMRAISVGEAAPGLICGEGVLGHHSPDADAQADIEQAFRIVRALGALDIGQAAVVCEGLALAVEAAEGTDALIARVAGLRDNLRGTPEKKRGVLVKALKPTQDTKTDMPVIGVRTVEAAAAAGLKGIALEAGASLIVDKKAVAAAADARSIFVCGVKL